MPTNEPELNDQQLSEILEDMVRPVAFTPERIELIKKRVRREVLAMSDSPGKSVPVSRPVKVRPSAGSNAKAREKDKLA